MKLLFISLFFVSLLNIQAQTIQEADLSIPITVKDHLGNQSTIQFGIDSIATDTIDYELGEANIPPDGCGWGFCAAFFLPENNYSGYLSSFKDYRFGQIPFSGQVVYRLTYATSGNSVTIYWYLPQEVTGRLQDIITGKVLDEPMVGIDSLLITNVNSFNRLKMTITYNQATPVELTSFTINVSENTVNLNWQTATETNNQGFAIERKQVFSQQSSASNEEWNAIGFVNGNGTTTESQSYSFVDKNISSGIYKYRLKQIDYDGTFDYSNEIEVEITPSEFALEQNYPNPFNPSTSIQYTIGSKQFVQLKVYDVLGNEIATLVNEEKPAGSYVVEFNVAQDSRPAIASGIYFYKLQAGRFVETKKMILIK